MTKSEPKPKSLSFEDTSIAFEKLSNKELKRANFLFSLMKPILIKFGAPILKQAVKWNLPIKGILKRTLFDHFCGGETLDEVKNAVESLKAYNVHAILDYGVEAKQSEEDFEATKTHLLYKLKYATEEPHLNIISSKITGLIRFELLEKVSAKAQLSYSESEEFKRGKARVEEICKLAHSARIQVYFDAEESWIQTAIDDIVIEMMEKYNHHHAIVFNTIQLYRKDRLKFLKNSLAAARMGNYLLAVKLVRGAYMEKEAARAKEMNYENPIQNSKADTDNDFNEALKFCMNHIGEIVLCCASHNEESTLMLANLIDECELENNHPDISFAQLYGMSDHMTFNLSKAGFYVSKYLVYGPLKEVIPYLIRRAQENSSVDGQMGKELKMIRAELNRRKSNN